MQDFEDQEDVYLHLIMSSQLSRLCFFEKKYLMFLLGFFLLLFFLFVFFFFCQGLLMVLILSC